LSRKKRGNPSPLGGRGPPWAKPKKTVVVDGAFGVGCPPLLAGRREKGKRGETETPEPQSAFILLLDRGIPGFVPFELVRVWKRAVRPVASRLRTREKVPYFAAWGPLRLFMSAPNLFRPGVPPLWHSAFVVPRSRTLILGVWGTSRELFSGRSNRRVTARTPAD